MSCYGLTFVPMCIRNWAVQYFDTTRATIFCIFRTSRFPIFAKFYSCLTKIRANINSISKGSKWMYFCKLWESQLRSASLYIFYEIFLLLRLHFEQETHFNMHIFLTLKFSLQLFILRILTHHKSKQQCFVS